MPPQNASALTLAPLGTGDANIKSMNVSLQARVRHIFTREFYRRGCLTWDMKMALQSALAGR